MSMSLRHLQIAYHWRLSRSYALPYVPEDISIEVTNTCNFRCQFCPQSNPDHFQRVPRTQLTPENCNIILGRLREGGVRTEVVHWTLDGEPFVNRQFGDICAVGQRHGFKRAIFSSNGALATLDRLQALPRCSGGTYHIAVDFCADSAYFEDVRGTPGSWQRVLDNVRAGLAATDLQHISFCLTDISSFRHSDPTELKERMQAMRDLFPASARLSFRTRTFHNAAGFLPLRALDSSTAKYHLCPYPWISMVVACNGDVVACCRDLEHKTVLGNLLRQSLGDVWNGEPFQRLRQALKDQHPELAAACNKCDLPWDASKFSIANIAATLRSRLGFGTA